LLEAEIRLDIRNAGQPANAGNRVFCCLALLQPKEDGLQLRQGVEHAPAEAHGESRRFVCPGGIVESDQDLIGHSGAIAGRWAAGSSSDEGEEGQDGNEKGDSEHGGAFRISCQAPYDNRERAIIS
jgi:hypothetical protein